MATIDNHIGDWLIQSTDVDKFVYARTTSKVKAKRLVAKEWTAFNVEIVQSNRPLTYHSVIDAE